MHLWRSKNWKQFLVHESFVNVKYNVKVKIEEATSPPYILQYLC